MAVIDGPVIVGTVRNARTGAPMAGVTVEVGGGYVYADPDSTIVTVGTATAELPVPGAGDAGKVLTVKVDTTGYELDVPVEAIDVQNEIAAAITASNLELNDEGAWVTATVYQAGQGADAGGIDYMCVTDHTSGTFSTDLANQLWRETGVNSGAIEVVPAGGLGTTPTAVKTATYGPVVGDYAQYDTSGGAITGNLMPQAPPDKSVVDVYLENGTATLTMQAQGSDVFGKVGGATTSTLTTASQKKRYVYCAALAVWKVYDFFSLTGINALIAAGSGGAVAGAHGSLTTPAATSGTGDTALFVSTAYAANTLAVGSTIKIRCGGIASATGTLQFKVHLGTTGTVSDTVVATSKITAAMAVSQWADVDAAVTVRTTGSSGTCIGSFLGVSGPSLIPNSTAAAATSAVDTTQANFLTISCATSNGTFTAEIGFSEQII